ncbi:hypothetical protein [Burkholderia anthina]|uniref:hypothetical protein n=1 Tax=Burkholderia anthina TaxID=179879 RepID=UPI00158DCFC1|nr:hypothetical protein [Burkholderia anthina]
MRLSHNYAGETWVCWTLVVDDFGNELHLCERQFELRVMVAALRFTESGEVR